MTHSQLLVKLKSESKCKTTEGGGVGARSLVHNTLRGRGACWSSRMGLGRIDKLHSLTRLHTTHTRWLVHSWSTFGLRRAIGTTDTQDSPWLELGGSHHLPPYNILCTSPRGPHLNGFSLPRLPSGSPEIAPARTPATLEPHNFARKSEVRSKTKL
jgi:hypothetical protein